jgi:transposase-like protein
MFDKLRSRGVQKIGLMVADGITGLDTVIGQKFPGTAFQRCTTHIKRNMLAHVRHGDKTYTLEDGVQAWKDMCTKWGKHYRSIKKMTESEDVAFYLTYLNYVPQIQSMIHTTNWIERL